MAMHAYTMVDLLVLGVIAAIFAVVFYAAWSVYYLAEAMWGPIVARVVSYGLWFMPAPLAASILKKYMSAFLGEFLPALLESIIPTPGGLTNAVYGLFQGLASEAGYAMFRYRRFDLVSALIAGALAGIPAVALDAVLFEAIYPWDYMVLILASAMASGALYGGIAYSIAKAIRK